MLLTGLSSEPALILLTIHVVSGTAGLGFVILAVYRFAALYSGTAHCSLLTIEVLAQSRPQQRRGPIRGGNFFSLQRVLSITYTEVIACSPDI